MPTFSASMLRSALHRVVLWRFIIALAGIFSMQLLPEEQSGQIISPEAQSLVSRFLFGVCLLNLLYYLAIESLPRTGFLRLQFFIDFLLISILVYLTNGPQSPFIVLYIVAILGSNMLLPESMSAASALLATLLMSAISLLYYSGNQGALNLPFVLPGNTANTNPSWLVLSLCYYSAFFFVVAFLSGALMGRLARTEIVHAEILQSMGEGLIALDQNGLIIYMNDRAENMMNLPASELFGKKAVECMSIAYPALAESLAAPDEGLLDLQMTNRAKERIPVRVTLTPIRDQSGVNRGMIAILKDVGQERELEEMRQRESRFKSLSVLSAGIAHEIRNPLASIRGSVQELADESTTPEQRAVMMNILLKESDRLNGIIDDFLEFASPKKPSITRCHLQEVMEEAALLLRKRADAEPFDIQCLFPLGAEQLPRLMADPEMLKQVFLNLGINGIQALVYAETKNPKLLFSAKPLERMRTFETKKGSSYYHRAQGVLIEVTDNGPGITPALKDKIFAPFVTSKPGGTGMGLAVVHRIIDEHQGSIRVDMDYRGGAKFEIWLPLTQHQPEPGSATRGKS